jgi:hypothetical protein
MKRQGSPMGFTPHSPADEEDNETAHIRDYATMVSFLAENDVNSVWYKAFYKAFVPKDVMSDTFQTIWNLANSTGVQKKDALLFIKHYQGFKKALIKPPKPSPPGSPSY